MQDTAQELRPEFTVPAIPAEVDAGLLELPADAWVLIHSKVAGCFGHGSCRAGDAVREIQQTMERQARGYFTLGEAATALAEAHGLDACDFLARRMVPACHTGVLAVIDPKDKGPLSGRECMPSYDLVTPVALNAWLEHDGYPFRWPWAAESQKQPCAKDDYMTAVRWTPEEVQKLAEVVERSATWAEVKGHYNRSRTLLVDVLKRHDLGHIRPGGRTKKAASPAAASPFDALIKRNPLALEKLKSR